MKYLILPIVLWCALVLPVQGQRDCGLEEQIDYVRHHYPDLWTKHLQPVEETMADFRSQVVLPIVVHVVYSGEKNNISDFQIHSQIEALNEGFNGQIPLSDDILPEHRQVIAPVNWTFQLACRDPDGKYTPGITRTKTEIKDIGEYIHPNGLHAVHHTELGGRDPWDSRHYINIWVAEMDDNRLGQATFPMPLADSFQAGIVVNSRHFGYAGLPSEEAPYHLGRTLIHEMGHYFDLHHPWGSGQGACDDDDGVEDTPDQSEQYFHCPSSEESISCGSPDMTKNFMGYADDECLQYFTRGQMDRMTMALMTYRSDLLTSSALVNCEEVTPSTDGSTASLWYRMEINEWIIRLSEAAGDIRFSLYNMLGQQVRDGHFQNVDLVHLSTSTLPDGVYVLHFDYDGQSTQWQVAVY